MEIAQLQFKMRDVLGIPEKQMPIVVPDCAKSVILALGRMHFNRDGPQQGISYLIDHGILEEEPGAVAEFLWGGEGLCKAGIGDYLGDHREFNLKVLHAYVGICDFSQLDLLQAMREFLWKFKLPGEAQKIDRIMEEFAEKYFATNPLSFKSKETTYLLSFAIIMANTDLHNPNVINKMTLDQFKKMTRGIDGGRDIPRALLQRIFRSIQKKPFAFPESRGQDFTPLKEGWLLKRGKHHMWHRRWFAVNDGSLYYFKTATEKIPLGVVELCDIRVQGFNNQPYFELRAAGDAIKWCKNKSRTQMVVRHHASYQLFCEDDEEREKWVSALKEAIYNVD